MQYQPQYVTHDWSYRKKAGLLEVKKYMRVSLSLLYEPENHEVDWKHVYWLRNHWNWKKRGDIWVYRTKKGFMVLSGNHRTYAMKLKGVKTIKVRYSNPTSFMQYTDIITGEKGIMEAKQFVSKFYDYHNDLWY